MRINKECCMIQDLLPSYIDKLTSAETNEYIENHINNCQECKSMLNNMRINNKDNQETIMEEIKYINFAKKYNVKFNILKIILVIIITIFIILFLRKVFIIKNLSAKAKNYEDISNYYSIYYQYGLNDIIIIESYNKDGNYLRACKTIERKSGEILNTLTECKKDNVINLYIDTPEEKKVILNIASNAIMPIELKSYYLEFNNMWNFIRNCIFSNVKKVECNGVKCYRFMNLYNSQVADLKYDNYVYINATTGLPIRATNGVSASNKGTYNNITEFYYEFNSVTDEDIVVPNVEEYVVQN